MTWFPCHKQQSIKHLTESPNTPCSFWLWSKNWRTWGPQTRIPKWTLRCTSLPCNSLMTCKFSALAISDISFRAPPSTRLKHLYVLTWTMRVFHLHRTHPIDLVYFWWGENGMGEEGFLLCCIQSSFSSKIFNIQPLYLCPVLPSWAVTFHAVTLK